MTDATATTVEPATRRTAGPVLVLMDDSYEAAEALLWARRFAPHRLGTIAVRVWNAGLGEFAAERHRASKERVHAELLRACGRLTSHDEVGPEACMVLEGDMPRTLETYAVAVESPLIVVGVDPPTAARAGEASSYHRGLAHQVVGSAVGFVPTAGAARPFRRLVVGVDGSASSLAALSWTAPVAARLGLDVHVVAVLEPMLEWVPSNDPASQWQRTRRLLDGAWTEALRNVGVRYVTEVLEGLAPADALARYGLDQHADLFVLGASQRAGRLHTRRGAVATHVAHTTGLAVVMTPAPPEI